MLADAASLYTTPRAGHSRVRLICPIWDNCVLYSVFIKSNCFLSILQCPCYSASVMSFPLCRSTSHVEDIAVVLSQLTALTYLDLSFPIAVDSNRLDDSLILPPRLLCLKFNSYNHASSCVPCLDGLTALQSLVLSYDKVSMARFQQI